MFFRNKSQQYYPYNKQPNIETDIPKMTKATLKTASYTIKKTAKILNYKNTLKVGVVN